MSWTPQILSLVIAIGLILIALALRRPPLGSRASLRDHASAFIALAALPVMITGLGLSNHLERSKSTSFCLSCHVMEPYGESLRVDPADGHVPASHFQNKRIPRQQACFACHTQYTMFGDLKAKIQGVKHLYVYYLGTVPEQIELYQPYRNRECLWCHADARSFEENELHADIREELQSDQTSCLECHGAAHDIEDLDDYGRWTGHE